jgi:hypothetical protein
LAGSLATRRYPQGGRKVMEIIQKTHRREMERRHLLR